MAQDDRSGQSRIKQAQIKQAVIKAGQILDHIRNFCAISYLNRLCYINPAGLSMLGFNRPAALHDKALVDILHKTCKEIGAIDLALLAKKDDLAVKFAGHRGKTVDVFLQVKALSELGPDAYFLQAFERKKHLTGQKHREQHLQAVLDAVPDCILTLDSARRILRANPAACREFGIDISEILYRDLADFVPHLGDCALSDFRDSNRDQADPPDKYWFGIKCEKTFPIELVIRAIEEDQAPRYICIIRNVEDRVLAEDELRRHLLELQHKQKILEGQASEAVFLAEKLEIQKQASEHLALHDPLSNLPNRRFFNEFLEKSIQRVKQEGGILCLLFIDLDKFKDVNDTLGHKAGDDLLLQVASRLKKNTRNDDMVARLGGDEFAVILSTPGKVDKRIFAQIADRILTDLYISVGDQNLPLQISASIGVALYPENAASAEALITLADAKMYESKNRGRNRAIFAD